MRLPLPERSIALNALPALFLACLLALPSGADAAMQPCGSPATALADVRAPGQASAQAGRMVELQAIVTADFSGDEGLRGFFLQTADAQRVHRPGGSEGLFVYAPRTRANVGDMVRVSGKIEEKFGQTQLVLAGSLLVCTQGLSVTPRTLTLPLADESDLAALEGMLVRLPQTLTVSDTHELGRYGTVVLSHGRPIAPTQQALPGPQARQAAADNARNRLLLDDGSTRQFPAVVPYPPPRLSTDHPLRAGDTVTGVQGVLERRHGQWRLQPVRAAGAPLYRRANPRPAAPPRHPATALRVAAFNLQNYFNGDGVGGGLDAPGNRGAQDAAALARQQAKLVAALRALDADVIGLMEVQNNGYGPTGAIRQLAALLGPDWRVADPGTPALGTDAIAVGLLYNARTALPAGRVASTWLGERSRQPLAATFRAAAGGAPVTVVVNHFKSKNCVEAAGAHADQRDGQGCWNPARVQAADTLARWLGMAPTGVADAGVLVIGDLNSYAMEDPLRLLARRGYADMVARFAGPQAYSYVYEAQAGYLDHVLADAAAAAHVVAVHAWHINADEPAAFSYVPVPRANGTPALYAPGPYRSSDHDPLVVDLASSPRAR
ncbi:ExeM/NucH family extracellular endonuclease [Cupriavidus taiwanensis]|uniref:ExeM/NucH family extracellular endonuclease n=1 Tax=Cupriavidus taiwanensis TaxID=164546 RepID=UPI000E0FFF12|nr:ExeM/NucH family extracellular endonuclease [Cupriavidus taiwanensis]SOY61387.1 putative Endonuclease/exonuclease/phosphatase [Cupriavidus taiwanensis]SOY73896.1 putative Endonuclease/exonuclease/phosphatase [Cupriavidus taiwanensis]SOY97880.1 putative Endonuclease/exonuclease/phosphatase [Cupriavidus taiwanensis]SOZ67709.1 putative Endonuclease/exonuclease/phosphatase [Cupriavidus taiwanensis]SOZ84800.1 putative Endonuclease/exonuclease/phosphatase [Cupriavidus taiwanensis]